MLEGNPGFNPDRQLLSKKGTRVNIAENKDSFFYGAKVSVGVGEMMKMKDIRDKGAEYSFDSPARGDVWVGKEGTLIYSPQDGSEAAHELAKAVVVVPSGTEGVTYLEPNKDPELEQLRERIKGVKVADIHQVEVLPEHQGKGIAGSLLDVALWDIEKTKGLPFAVARVDFWNPDGQKMLAVFEKAGFKKYLITGSGWDAPDKYYLVVRESAVQL